MSVGGLWIGDEEPNLFPSQLAQRLVQCINYQRFIGVGRNFLSKMVASARLRLAVMVGC